jgi:hypothetical protein
MLDSLEFALFIEGDVSVGVHGSVAFSAKPAHAQWLVIVEVMSAWDAFLLAQKAFIRLVYDTFFYSPLKLILCVLLFLSVAFFHAALQSKNYSKW